MRVILTTTVAVATLAGICVACARAEGSHDGRLDVVASFYPLQAAAERIGGNCVAVTNLTPPGAEPHDVELSPDGVEAIATADLVLYLGGGFQPAIEDALGDAEGTTVDMLHAVETKSATAAEAREEGLSVDPHVWLDPGRFSIVAQAIGDALTSAGVPTDCEVDRRVRTFRTDLADLDQEFRQGLADCRSHLIVTNHAAFGYLAEAYGLRQEPISGLEPDAEPTPQRLAELADLVVREHVTTVFTEELVSPKVADTLAREAGVRTAVLHTIEGLTREEVAAGEEYVSLMRENLAALRSALGCR